MQVREAIREWWPEMGKLRGLKRLNFMIREVMFPFAASIAQEVLDVTASFQPDVLVFDAFTHPASIVADITGLPWATTTVVPGLLDSMNAHPYGLGLTYPPNPLQHLATPLLRRLFRLAARRHDRQFNAIRTQFSLPPIRDSYLESTISPYLVLALAPPQFEYPRALLAACCAFRRPFPLGPPARLRGTRVAGSPAKRPATCLCHYRHGTERLPIVILRHAV